MSSFEERRKGRNTRKHEFRTPHTNSYLIVTEGESTEPNYFNGLRSIIQEKVGGNVEVVNLPKIDVRGTGKSTGRLIEKVNMIVNKSKIMYQNIWVVFDKDDFQDFDSAIKFANEAGYKVAWSNQSFEYWLYLHFYYSDVALHRDQWVEKLDDLFKQHNLNGGKYSKNCSELYVIMDMNNGVEKAIVNAKRRMESFDYQSDLPSKYEPGTTVYQLVEELKKYID